MMVIWRIFLPSSMLTSVRPYRQVLLEPLYTMLDLIDHLPEFERRNRMRWRRWFYVGTRSEEWFTMCCERQSGWCEILGRRISVWKSSGEYWILEILIIRVTTCRILFTFVISICHYSNYLTYWPRTKKKLKRLAELLIRHEFKLVRVFLTSWSKTFLRVLSLRKPNNHISLKYFGNSDWSPT